MAGLGLHFAISSMMNLMNFRRNSKPRSSSSILPPLRLIALLSLRWNITFLSTLHLPVRSVEIFPVWTDIFLLRNNVSVEREREVRRLITTFTTRLKGHWAAVILRAPGVSQESSLLSPLSSLLNKGILLKCSLQWSAWPALVRWSEWYLFYKQIVQRSVMKSRRSPW